MVDFDFKSLFTRSGNKLRGIDMCDLCVRQIWSKKISNNQELIQSDPTYCPKTKSEITKYINWQKFTKGTRGKPNEQLFPRQVVI